MRRPPKKAVSFWPLFLAVFITDRATKHLADHYLSPPGTPHEFLGNAVRFTLAFNQGGALGIETGRGGHLLLIVFGLVMVAVLAWFYHRIPRSESEKAVATALLMGGALGNLLDRITSTRGVVDFIDLGIGSLRFWTFNVADMGITFGAVLLAWILWREAKTDTMEASRFE